VTNSDWNTPDDLRQQCRELYGLEQAPRWGPLRDMSLETFGPMVGKIMTGWGEPPTPFQQYVLDTSLEVVIRNGMRTFKYSRVGLSIMRQQGKTTMAYALMTWRAMAFANSLIYYAAQDRNNARNRLEDELWYKIQGCIFNGKRLRPLWQGKFTNGNERLIYNPKMSRIRIVAPTKSGGHGPPLDMAFLDEIFKHTSLDLMQAVSPAMLTRWQWGQLWWGSNAGDETSLMLNKERAAGRLVTESFYRYGNPSRYAYYEWSFPEGVEFSDAETWLRYMPNICPNPPCTCDPKGVWHHTCTVEKVMSEYESMIDDPGQFTRAYGNVTSKSRMITDERIPRIEWGKVCADKNSTIDLSRGIVLCPEVTSERDTSSISVAGYTPDGLWHMECIDRRHGVDWLAPALKRLSKLWQPLCVVIDEKGPAAPIIPQLEDRGIRSPRDPDRPRQGDLARVNLWFVTAATSRWVDEVKAGRIRHRDQPHLTAAVGNAVTRPVGGDGWVISRRTSGADVTPLTAAILARHALERIAPNIRKAGYDVVSGVA